MIAVTHYDPDHHPSKTFVDRQHSQRLWSERPKIDHRVDGIVLQEAQSSYEMGTSKAHTSLVEPECTVDLEGPRMPLRRGRMCGTSSLSRCRRAASRRRATATSSSTC